MKKLHVVYILTKLELGGAQKICLKLFSGLRSLGAETTLISGNEGVLVNEAKQFDNVYLLDSFKREVSLKSLWQEIKTFFKIVKYLRKLKRPDVDLVVHTHSTKAGLLGRFAALFAGVSKRVHTVHGFGFNAYQPWPKWFIIYFVELITSFITTHYICVSRADLDYGSRVLPRFLKKSSIIRAAVDWDKFYLPAIRADGWRSGEFIFGTISCFKPQKNLMDLLEAFKVVHLYSDQVRLQIIGDGQMRNDIEDWIKRNDLHDHIDLLGWQSNVVSWMQSWSVYVMSSLWEGLPCSIVEARLQHLPVIAYNVGGISEVIRHGDNGYLIDPKNIHDLSEKMLSLFNDPELHKRLSNHRDDLLDFSDKHMVREHFKMYSGLF